MKRTHITAVLTVLSFALTVLSSPAASAAETRLCHLSLKSALPGDKPMAVHLLLAGGKVAASFGEARTFNTMSYRVDASKVKITPKGLAGPITVTVPSDGWVPKGVSSVTCRYTLSAVFRDGQVTGSFEGHFGQQDREGKIAGTTVSQKAKPDRCRFALKVRSPKGTKGLSRVGIEFGWRDGKPIGVKLIPHGSITDIGAATIVKKATLRWQRSRLTGTIQGVLQPNGKVGRPIVLELDCLVIGQTVGGSVRSRVGTDEWSTGSVRGQMNVSPVPDPSDAIWKLTLQHGVSKGQPMNVFVSTRRGNVAGAFAVTPNYNNATHQVDASQLSVKAGRLEGRIDVTVFPDAWVPKNHKKQSASYRIRARHVDAEAMGTFEGQFADRKVAGQIEGVLRSKPNVGAIRHATIKPEGGLWNGSQSGYRAFFTFDMKDGKITGGRVWNNHDKALKGDILGGTFQIKDETLTATMIARIQPGTSAKPGRYTIQVKGPVMGTVSCGRSTSALGEKTWTSRYWASWTCEETANK